MKIGFDAKRAAQNPTGLGNYSRFVLRILSEQHQENKYHLYIPKANRTPYLSEIPTIQRLTKHFPTSAFARRFCSLWRTWGMTADIKRDGMDIFHGLSNELPLNIKRANCKTVVTIHDVIFRRYPEYYHLIDRIIYDFKFRRACQLADRVIAVSEFTKKEIMRCYGTPENKIDVVYQGCDKAFAAPISRGKLDEVRERYGLPNEYLLYVGSIEERKNLMLVAKALRLMEKKPTVVAVGRRTTYTDKIKNYLEREGLTQHFLFFHKVPFSDLPAIYRMARTFVYPSRVEGFGIPLLEALSSGVPVIGCTGSCLEEAGGKDSLYVNPDDDKAMAKAITDVMNDDGLRQAMITKGRIFAARFSEERLCEDLTNVYEKLMNKRIKK